MNEFTAMLADVEAGKASSNDLLPLVYSELRRIAAGRMAHERENRTLQPTALVHEAWLRLGGDAQAQWRNRKHFFASAAEAMRRILVDRARKRSVRRASGLAAPEELHESRIAARSSDEELLDVHEALEELAQVNEVAANLVKLRYFAGMSLIEAAAALDLAQRSAERLWTFSRSWLRDALVKKNSST